MSASILLTPLISGGHTAPQSLLWWWPTFWPPVRRGGKHLSYSDGFKYSICWDFCKCTAGPEVSLGTTHLIWLFIVYMNILFLVHSTVHLWREDKGQLVGGHSLCPSQWSRESNPCCTPWLSSRYLILWTISPLTRYVFTGTWGWKVWLGQPWTPVSTSRRLEIQHTAPCLF